MMQQRWWWAKVESKLASSNIFSRKGRPLTGEMVEQVEAETVTVEVIVTTEGAVFLGEAVGEARTVDPEASMQSSPGAAKAVAVAAVMT
jgi:hypothetical protein